MRCILKRKIALLFHFEGENQLILEGEYNIFMCVFFGHHNFCAFCWINILKHLNFTGENLHFVAFCQHFDAFCVEKSAF